MKTDKLLHLLQQKKFMRSGGALPLPKHQWKESQTNSNQTVSPGSDFVYNNTFPEGAIRKFLERKSLADEPFVPGERRMFGSVRSFPSDELIDERKRKFFNNLYSNLPINDIKERNSDYRGHYPNSMAAYSLRDSSIVYNPRYAPKNITDSLELLFAEAPHAIQLKESGNANLISDKHTEDFLKAKKAFEEYDTPGTIEYNAHREIEPILKDDYFNFIHHNVKPNYRNTLNIPSFKVGGRNSVLPLPKAQNGKASNFLQPNSSKLKEGYAAPSKYPSTELATSIGGENGEPAYLVPSFKYGHPLANPEDEFYNTGDYLGGPFKTWQEADKWDREIRHPYVEKGQPIPSPLKWWGEGYRQGGSLPKAQTGIPTNQYNRDNPPIKVTDPNDLGLKAYRDSSFLYNLSKRREMQFNKDPFDSRLNEYGKEVDGLAKRLKMNPIAYRQGWDSSNFTEFPFNSPDAEYYLQSDEPYIAKYKKPVQPYVYDPNIPLMQKKGMPNINIDKTPIKTKETKGRSNDWYMDTRGEWTNIPLQQYIHGANKFQLGGQDYTSDSAYDLYKQTPPIVEYNPRDTPEFQQLAKQYDIVQGEINKFVPVDNYVKRLKEVTAKAVKDKVSVEKTDFVDKDIRDDPKSNFCISGSCYLADQAGDKSFKYYSNDLAQKAAEKKQGRYLEQDEKWITPGDIMQFKRGNSEKGGPYHAYTVLELGEPNTNGSRSIQVAGSPGSGPIKYEQYFLGKDNKVYKDAALSERLYTQLLKRISPNISDSGNLVKERDALKMQMDKIDATYLNPERQGRNVNNRTTEFFFDQDAWKGGNPEKFNYDEPDRDATYTEGKNPGEQINPKNAKLFDMMGKYSDNGYKTKFMKDHNISGPEYDAIVKNMFGIYGAETKFGTDNWAGGKFPEPRWLTDTFGVGDSVGPFQLGRKNFSKKLKDKYTRKELHDPMIASEATLEFLAENLPLLRKRALDTPDQKTYTQNITQDNYLEFIPYLHNAQSWLKGDKATLKDKKKKDVVRGDHDYKKLVDFYASKFQAIPISIEGNGPVIEDSRYDSEWVTPSNVDKKQTGGLAKAQLGIPNPFMPGKTLATGAIEKTMSPIDVAIAAISGVGLLPSAIKLTKSIANSGAESHQIPWLQSMAAISQAQIANTIRDTYEKVTDKKVGGLAKAQEGIPSVATANQQAIQNAGTPYLNRAMVQAILANANQPVTNTLGRVISTPASREKERRKKVIANDPSKYSVMPGFQSDYNLGIKEPGADNSVLADPIAMAAMLAALPVAGVTAAAGYPARFLANLGDDFIFNSLSGLDPTGITPTALSLGTRGSLTERFVKAYDKAGKRAFYVNPNLGIWNNLPENFNVGLKTAKDEISKNLANQGIYKKGETILDIAAAVNDPSNNSPVIAAIRNNPELRRNLAIVTRDLNKKFNFDIDISNIKTPDQLNILLDKANQFLNTNSPLASKARELYTRDELTRLREALLKDIKDMSNNSGNRADDFDITIPNDNIKIRRSGEDYYFISPSGSRMSFTINPKTKTASHVSFFGDSNGGRESRMDAGKIFRFSTGNAPRGFKVTEENMSLDSYPLLWSLGSSDKPFKLLPPNFLQSDWNQNSINRGLLNSEKLLLPYEPTNKMGRFSEYAKYYATGMGDIADTERLVGLLNAQNSLSEIANQSLQNQLNRGLIDEDFFDANVVKWLEDPANPNRGLSIKAPKISEATLNLASVGERQRFLPVQIPNDSGQGRPLFTKIAPTKDLPNPLLSTDPQVRNANMGTKKSMWQYLVDPQSAIGENAYLYQPVPLFEKIYRKGGTIAGTRKLQQKKHGGVTYKVKINKPK